MLFYIRRLTIKFKCRLYNNILNNQLFRKVGIKINTRKTILTVIIFCLMFASFVAYDYFRFEKLELGTNLLKTLFTFFFMFLYQWSSNSNKKYRSKTHK